MRRLIETTLAATALLTLAACGGGDSGAPTDEELNNAAEMLDTEDASADSLTIEDPALGNGDAPAQTGDVLVTDEAAVNGTGANAQ